MGQLYNFLVSTDFLLYANALVSAGLLVLIWLIQLMHYPSFRFIDEKKWQAFHRHHTISISYVVMPLMLIELGIAVLLFIFWRDVYMSINLVIVILLWMITFLSAIPMHNRLSETKDVSIIERLIRMNWWRTGLWTAKFLLALHILDL